VRESQAIEQARCALGAELATLRRAAGYSQAELARLTTYSRSTVANVETGRQHAPHDFWQRADTAVHAGGALAAANDDVDVAVRREREAEARAAGAARLASAGQWHPGNTKDGDQRRAEMEVLRQGLSEVLNRGAVTGASLDEWEQAVLRYGRATRDRPAGVLVADLAADLAELKQTIERCHSASSLRRLTRVTAHMSGLMCLLFVNLDERAAFAAVGAHSAGRRQRGRRPGDVFVGAGAGGLRPLLRR